jgi:hypothetical protein
VDASSCGDAAVPQCKGRLRGGIGIAVGRKVFDAAQTERPLT